MILTTALLTLAATHPTSGHITLSGFSAEERGVVFSALQRYEAAGLTLPRTHIRRVGDGSGCGVKARSWDLWPVKLMNLCLVREDIVVHELAHVWSFTALSRLEKSAWVDRRHTASWRSRIHAWEDRGTEHAADIMTWDLYWSDLGITPSRISGDVSVDAYLADVAWLLEHAAAPKRMSVHRASGPFVSSSHLPSGARSPIAVPLRGAVSGLRPAS